MRPAGRGLDSTGVSGGGIDENHYISGSGIDEVKVSRLDPQADLE